MTPKHRQHKKKKDKLDYMKITNYIKEHNQQSEQATHRIGENIGKSYI